jgi:ubiquinone/menaquinone biosynthesis C-methylase UbiE
MTNAQNIYDNPEFFKNYRELRRTGSGLNEALEQPALEAMLPASLEGIRVLDIGCGFGDFARKSASRGAEQVLAIDISELMIAEAKRQTNDARIHYQKMAIEELIVNEQIVDLVVSSLVLHYVKDYLAALRKIAKALPIGGHFIFSVEHPICTALAEQRWVFDEEGRPKYWPIDNYRVEGHRHTTWFVEGVIKYHRTIESYIGGLLSTGFSIRHFLEPQPTDDAVLNNPDLELHCRRPPFLVIAARKEADI